MEIKLSQQSDVAPLVLDDSETDLQEPQLYDVILLNDDYTPMDFVIEVLMYLFQKNYNDAYAIMMQVHQQSRGIAGTYTREIAEEKVHQVIYAAQNNEFPLDCLIERH